MQNEMWILLPWGDDLDADSRIRQTGGLYTITEVHRACEEARNRGELKKGGRETWMAGNDDAPTKTLPFLTTD